MLTPIDLEFVDFGAKTQSAEQVRKSYIPLY